MAVIAGDACDALGEQLTACRPLRRPGVLDEDSPKPSFGREVGSLDSLPKAVFHTRRNQTDMKARGKLHQTGNLFQDRGSRSRCVMPATRNGLAALAKARVGPADPALNSNDAE
jgi:hypothetical protein